MEWVEVTARSVEEAKEAALDQLGVDESEAEFEVVEVPRPGLFGRLRAEARVRARVKPSSPRPKQDRRDRHRRADRSDTQRGGQRADAPAPRAAEPGSTTSRTSRAPGDGGRPTSGEASDSGASRAGGAGDGDGGGQGGRRSRRRRGRGGGGDGGGGPGDGGGGGGGAVGGRSRAEAGEATTRGGSRRRRDQADRDGLGVLPARDGPARDAVRGAVRDIRVGPEEDMGEHRGSDDVEAVGAGEVDVAREFVSGLFDAFGVDVQISDRELDEGHVEIAATGGDLGILIGPRGQTLLAVQELARTVVQRQARGSASRILVDISGYRQARRDALTRFAHEVAQQVTGSGVARVLEPMPPADRKVVHDAINGIEGVRTSSEGEEPYRRVVISPVRMGESSGLDAG